MLDKIKAIAAAAAVENLGDPAVFGVVQEVQDFLEDPEAVAAVFAQIRSMFVHDASGGREHSAKLWGASGTAEDDAAAGPQAPAGATGGGGGGGGEGGEGGEGEVGKVGEGDEASGAGEGAEDDGAVTDEQLTAFTNEALATTRAAEQPAAGQGDAGGGGGGGGPGSAQLRWKGGKGDRGRMYWGSFTVGLVGKPSAGKSTFFNACKTIGTAEAKVRTTLAETKLPAWS